MRPLIHGNTTVIFEGKPVGTPDPGTFWRVIQEHKVKFLLHRADRASAPIKREDPERRSSSSRNDDLSGPESPDLPCR